MIISLKAYIDCKHASLRQMKLNQMFLIKRKTGVSTEKVVETHERTNKLTTNDYEFDAG